MEDVNVRLLFCDFFLTVFIMVIMLMIQNNEMLNESVISFVGAGMIGKVKNWKGRTEVEAFSYICFLNVKVKKNGFTLSGESATIVAQ